MDAMDPPLSVTVMTLEQRKIPLKASKFLRVELLKAMVEEAKEYGEHATIGVLWDYCCLPQRPYRNDEEAQRFKLSLRGMK